MQRPSTRPFRALVLLSTCWLVACGGDAGGDLASTSGSPGAPEQTVQFGLSGVWASGPDDVWVVGGDGAVFHQDGSGFRRVATPTTARLIAIHGRSADDVWAVGDDVILHWDGSEWSAPLTDMSEELIGVWATGPDDVWMAGLATDVDTGLLRHWDGTEWTAALTSSAKTLWEVWANDAGDVWTGGTSPTGDGFLAHGDGSAFDAADYAGGSPRGLWGSATDDVWIAPWHEPFQHWDGVRWSATDAAFSALSLSGSGPTDVWAAGIDGTIAHYDGAAWSTSASGTTNTLASVWATAADDAWAVGGGGTVLHWNGAAWNPAPLPVTEGE
ncbi:MAG TPA: hypothetical protein VHE30_02975 [Polyangiaceae bacterium]|nr:hypothetical protein [Polyangiaceae bacterium]